MQTGWQKINGKWYYLDPNFGMLPGWGKLVKKVYYFYSDGSMAANTTIDGFRLGKDGTWIPSLSSY